MPTTEKMFVKDGQFRFEVYTDHLKFVHVNLISKYNDDPKFYGTAIIKGDDVFDFHKGLHIAIRKCLNSFKSNWIQECTKQLKKVTNALSNCSYYDKDKFEAARVRAMKKVAKRKAKTGAE